MPHPEPIPEEDLTRLLQAGYGPAARPSPAAQRRALLRLRAGLPRRPGGYPFPEPLALLLSVAWLGLAACVLLYALGAGSGPAAPAAWLAGAAVVSNLLCIPFGCIYIVRRRHHASKMD
ncbi:MAG: hypothetical protein GYA17_17160 [Chloroflexi bacterium]|jgi:hypothetical protein|nr:hypothetical protein [Anaerolineaceae bacterium]NMB90089.1 hypothetical protein [Chloroflexota bacterium]